MKNKPVVRTCVDCGTGNLIRWFTTHKEPDSPRCESCAVRNYRAIDLKGREYKYGIIDLEQMV